MKERTATVLKWIGLAVIASGILYAVLLGASNRSLRRAYSALEADGRPMTAAQVIPASIPDTANAALIYEAVVLQLKAEEAGEKDLFSQIGDLASEMLEKTPDSEVLKKFRGLARTQAVTDALLALKKGSGKPGCRYDLDYSKGAATLLPHVSDLRALTRILCAVARLQAADGDHGAAWATVITSLQLSDALKDEPITISQLVRMAQFGMAVETVQALSLIAPPTEQQYSDIDGLLRAFDDYAPYVAAMDGERLLMGEWAFDLPRSELRRMLGLFDGSGSQRVLSLTTTFPPLLRRDHASYLSVMHDYARNAEDAVLSEVLDSVPRYCTLTRLLVPALSRIKGHYVSMIAQARITCVGLAALRHRQEHDTYPDSLPSLSEQALVDPFSGKQLGYVVHPTGFTIYSIGENLIDDGGKKTEDRHAGDIVWLYRDKEDVGPAH